MALVSPPDILKTTVGSCIALVLFDKRQKLFGMAHIMMPSPDDVTPLSGDPGKYADSAILALLKQMRVPPPGAHRLQAKMAGGANMFATKAKDDAFKIGEKNRQSVVGILNQLGIPLLGVDCGGTHAREVWIEAKNVQVFVKNAGDGQIREL